MSIKEIGREIDKIVIDAKEARKINKWLIDTERSMGEMGKNKFFPLNNFILDIELYKNMRFEFLVELENFNPRIGRFSNDTWDITYRYDEASGGWHFDGMAGRDTGANDYERKEATRRMHSVIYGTMLYIIEYAKKRTEKVSPEVTRKERENYEYKPRECYLLNDIVKYVSIHPNKHSIKYRCEVWGVRGHIRHYKNGKTVFIKPYKKGKRRAFLEPKSRTYLLTNDE